MKVVMKRYEKLAVDYADKFTSFDLKIAAKDSFLAGFHKGFSVELSDYDWIVEEIEVEFLDGEHQL